MIYQTFLMRRINYSRLKPYVSLLELIIALVLVIIIANPLVLSTITGSQAPLAVVKGESMLPVLREGDIVFTYRPSPSEINIGDVIVFRASSNKLIIHRVVDVKIIGGNYYYVTKGDNNYGPDIIYFDLVGNQPLGVSYNRVVGKVLSLNDMVVKIPYLGYISLWFQEIRSSLI
ncbi:MAG: signal peptidase I [Thermosphaera sp.]